MGFSAHFSGMKITRSPGPRNQAPKPAEGGSQGAKYFSHGMGGGFPGGLGKNTWAIWKGSHNPILKGQTWLLTMINQLMNLIISFFEFQERRFNTFHKCFFLIL